MTCWALGVALGAAAIVTSASPSQATPAGLSPATVANYLVRVAGPQARDIRVNGLYGSAHDGAWQFVAHLTWHGAAGRIHGGTTELPLLAGAAAMTSPFTSTRLTTEETIGWPLSQVARILRAVPRTDAPLAFVELDISTSDAHVGTCATNSVRDPAECEVVDSQGHLTARSTTRLTDEPTAGPLAVQRQDNVLLGAG